MLKRFLFLVGLLIMSCVLSGCGKVSPVSPIEDSGYPHNYPKN